MTAQAVELVTLLFAAVLALAAVARWLVVPYPILLVLGGLVLGFIPGLPPLEPNPDVIFFIFLPPILWAAAYFTSFRDFKRNLRPIALLAFGLVIATTGVVAMVARAVVPGLPWPAAVALGAIVSPPDAVAAAAVLRRLKIPYRVLVILEGESLVNDATALVLYRTAVIAMVTGGFSVSDAATGFVVAAVGGVAIGLVIGWIALLALERLHDPLTEIAITLLAPYFAWSIAERVHTSAVLACVAGGLLLRRHMSRVVAPGTRLQARAVWDLLVFALNGMIFILIGLALRPLAEAVPGGELPTLILQGLIVSAAAIAIRLAWVPVATALPRLIPSVREVDPMPPWPSIALVAWTGMRGIVSLAAALALPLATVDGRPLPFRAELILLTFIVIVVTLVVQGLTLAPLIRRLRLPEDTHLEEEEALARERAATAALARLDSMPGVEDHHAVQDLREDYHDRRRAFAEFQAGAPRSSSLAEAAFKRARHETLAAERRALIELRDRGDISDEVLLTLEEELDREALRHGLAHVRPER
ncbi:MAG TPA: Na+/H+ antiporter [Gemmatimonadales bacterium]|jgi:CPA1 family monovalent cation:H+ antiporter|nr:Na+/H+ antiporter [Gemmatimonadales bacterium]